jgi:ABC-2 type transport system ATP-binding protein
VIEVKDIVKNYGNHRAVDHLSFTLEKGKIYGFLGPNGAGKSTTMNIMTGYLAADEGTVTIEGYDIVRKSEEAKKHIGYLPEIPPLYTDMTVREYLVFAAELKRVPKAERKEQIQKILEMTQLTEYSDRMIRNLSKGYKQRVGLAQALIGFPDVIILDEPTVGLDPQQIIEIRNLIKSLKEDHIVILSSHILSEVNEVCDDVMIISHGKLATQGTPEELEEKFKGTEHIKLSILGNEAQIKGALVGVPDVSEIEVGEEPDSQGGLLVTVTNNSQNDIRADIARALAAAGLPVLSMEVEKKSLEDVFLEVTGESEVAESSVSEDDEVSIEDTKESSDDSTDEDTKSDKESDSSEVDLKSDEEMSASEDITADETTDTKEAE